MKLSDILRLTRGFRGKIAVITLTGIIRVVADLVFVALSKRAVDIATGNAGGELIHCLAGLAGIIILELICSSAGSRATEISQEAMKDKLQAGLFRHLLSASWSGQEKYHSGDVLSRLTEDCRVAAETLCRTLPTLLVALFQLVAVFLFLWYFSHALALTLLLLLPLFIIAGKAFYKRVRAYSRSIRDIESRLQERMQESLQHRILILAYGLTARIVTAVTELHRSRSCYVGRRTNLTVYSRTALLAGFEAGFLVAFIWGVVGLKAGTVTFGLMTAYLQLAGQLQRPIAEIARLVPGTMQSATAFSRLHSLDDIPREPAASITEQHGVTGGPTGIRFRNVTFSYPGKERPVIDRFTYTFPPGSRTAIMGPTGAGKSTILRLMLALLHPQEGHIDLIMPSGGGETSIPVSVSTRAEIAFVPQGNSLMSGTVRENLLIGNPDAGEGEMREALHAASADFVFDMKDGLDTPCGERGAGLSEGQAQRIAVARALLRPGSVMLLDEISASLDEATELLLMRRLTARRRSNTIILVTHRPLSARFCDNIINMPSPHNFDRKVTL